MIVQSGIEICGPNCERANDILTLPALDFIAALHREFNPTRVRLLKQRIEVQSQLDRGEFPSFAAVTAPIRAGAWKVAPLPDDLLDRRVEITGPADRKMIINGMNSGANLFMADFEDATSPTWSNLVEGQANLIDAIKGSISHTSASGKVYQLGEQVATLVVRPRGWHLLEKHMLVDGEPVSGSLFDFGLYFFHNAHPLLAKGTGPYFYLPKLENHQEARLWNEVFIFAQEHLGIPQGSIKATVLIENILAAFEMDEILFELREHAAGLNAGRWDYIFSLIKKFRNQPAFVLPDRSQISMTVPFMRAYTELLVKSCHRRGALAIGGMAAYIPSRSEPDRNERALCKVREDKIREVNDGFDGTWVAHPDLVPVAKTLFDQFLQGRPNQMERQREEVATSDHELLNLCISHGKITENGLRQNISVALQYLDSWLRGVGAVGIYNLMEDAATAEISRSQIWQWIRHGSRLTDDGPQITPALVRLLMDEELTKIQTEWGEQAFASSRTAEAFTLLEQMAIGPDFPEFLTLVAYPCID